MSNEKEFAFVFPHEKNKFSWESWFPKPVVKWENKAAEDKFSISPTTYDSASRSYRFEYNINLENDGTWVASLYDGTKTYSDMMTVEANIKVENTIVVMYPNSSFWYDTYETGKLAVFADDEISFRLELSINRLVFIL